ncbi:MAG: hypothetical protein M5U26_18100 [Planctomycetota bacterium]|nr:hypothetical protein [Planctomycetota bacterium]
MKNASGISSVPICAKRKNRCPKPRISPAQNPRRPPEDLRPEGRRQEDQRRAQQRRRQHHRQFRHPPHVNRRRAVLARTRVHRPPAAFRIERLRGRGRQPVRQRRLVDANLPVQPRHQPVARAQHFPGHDPDPRLGRLRQRPERRRQEIQRQAQRAQARRRKQVPPRFPQHPRRQALHRRQRTTGSFGRFIGHAHALPAASPDSILAHATAPKL